MAARRGDAVPGVWNDVDPAVEADYNAWYLREHVPERLSVPGMHRGRRNRAVDGSPRYAALYEAARLDVLTSGAYRAQLANPTEWIRRMMAGFRLMQRGIGRVIADVGNGVGGAATFVHLRPAEGFDQSLLEWIKEELPKLCELPDVVAAHARMAATGEPGSETTALTSGGAVNRPVHWVVTIETTEPASADAALKALMRKDPAARGATGVMEYPIYRLLFSRTAWDRSARIRIGEARR